MAQLLQCMEGVIETSVKHEIVIMVFYWMNEDHTVQAMDTECY